MDLTGPRSLSTTSTPSRVKTVAAEIYPFQHTVILRQIAAFLHQLPVVLPVPVLVIMLLPDLVLRKRCASLLLFLGSDHVSALGYNLHLEDIAYADFKNLQDCAIRIDS